MRRDALNLAQFDLICKLDLVSGFERSPQREHLVDDAARRPDITLLIVALLLNLLWAHVVRCADMGVGKDRLVAHHPAQPEIAQLHVLVRVEEDVAWFEVPVQDLVPLLPHVALQQSECQL